MNRNFDPPAALAGAAVALAPAWLLAADTTGGGAGIAGNFASTIWAIFSFLAVLFILWKMLLPPIIDSLDRRAREIREGLEAAARARAQSAEMMKAHQAELEKARREARAIIEESKAQAREVKEKILMDARSEAVQAAARARLEIDAAKEAALKEMQQRSVDLALDLAGRLIEKSLRASDHQQLIEERIGRFRMTDN